MKHAPQINSLRYRNKIIFTGYSPPNHPQEYFIPRLDYSCSLDKLRDKETTLLLRSKKADTLRTALDVTDQKFAETKPTGVCAIFPHLCFRKIDSKSGN
ncbi:hypothetical protein SSCH_2000002 [Syntrophaceticus schinkii]|uniref:Uncharacterized protein n=1 Tax=Syntrophaceticus schinkii TaxID=499207 RepID=A0A0B7MK16_9FIRM|nr:hypothetical protein SSCH_2000002 [Syntrophaceticus schinkii]